LFSPEGRSLCSSLKHIIFRSILNPSIFIFFFSCFYETFIVLLRYKEYGYIEERKI
jgi:hypothetical protein